MNAVERLRCACGVCGHLWTGPGSYNDAVECCRVEPVEAPVWLCCECDTYHRSQAEADACCLPEDEAGLILNPPRTPEELEAAGQMRLMP